MKYAPETYKHNSLMGDGLSARQAKQGMTPNFHLQLVEKFDEKKHFTLA